MFASWGSIVYRARFTVIGVMVAAMLGLAGYGLSLEDHLSQSGWDDPASESVAASILADETFGRDTMGDVLALYKAPDGTTVDDPEFQETVSAHLQRALDENPDQILKANGGFFEVGNAPKFAQFASEDRQYAIESIAIAGANDTEVTANFRAIKDVFYIDGIDVELAGLQPVAGALNDTMAQDIKRMELLAIPAVGILLFFVFGGIVAAALPLIIGGLTVVAANGVVRLITNFTEVNSFVAPVVSLVGLGLAIDYGLFIVSRFREELGEGYEVGAAVRRTVMTAGRTVVFSATTIVAALGGLVLFPQGFLKSVAYGAIATVTLAAIASITILPALLGIIGRRVDALTFKRLRQTKSAEEIEASVWGRLTRWVMRNPLKVTIPIVVGLLLLIVPLTGIKFGGINETYLPPDSSTRLAQEQFDEMFPGQRTEPVKLVVTDADGRELGTIIREASGAPGLVEQFTPTGPTKDGVTVLKAGLTDRNDSAATIEYLRGIDVPDGVQMLVGGTPAIEYDSIAALLHHLPIMVIGVVLLTTLLMFLAFGSLVLPIKAALMSALGLGSTLGILTWIFIDGHGSELLNFTPGPIMSPVLVLIIAIVYGLSIDYEVFLLSRMVEARAQGASTTEAIRIGTSHTGRIITAAALILIVVTGAFGFSELVMMKYIAYGMIAALVIDATLIRMFLVPAVMKLLGDDCWWAPAWMKRLQEKIGLGEPILDNELMPSDVPELTPVGAVPAAAGAGVATAVAPQRQAPRKPEPLTEPIPLVTAQMLAQQITDEQKAAEQARNEARRSATGRPERAPEIPDDVPGATAAPATSALPTERPAAPSAPGGGRPGGPHTESRPIESWLADLRSTSGRERPRPDIERSSPAPTGANGSPGHGSNGNGANEFTGANGHGATGNGANGRPANASPSSGGSTRNPLPPLPPRSRPQPPSAPDSGPTGAAPVTPSPRRPLTPPATEPRDEADATEQPSGRRHREEPTQGTAGRHRAEDSNAVSVSELIARQNRH
ncbi:MMPL family transporter [Rhodococcus triatomae]|uniref:Putative drug exporter of the RND superfamily n=1 Tax=Rhodococcus triatomae TaxID=300028 RepID=A0A1G8GRK5_9NOCA|nr:MMPL family transporter [Rhodococcus triatomae]QNG20317.1 MMPL family transporter [Rhodococcus triatomae]QNG23767.1 MMPL family transporter [Rhodococcus triatomae]SDH96930.1 putative drug exporter of the RND superfamily [Rhodococcus triatomae]